MIICIGCGKQLTPRRKDQKSCNAVCWRIAHADELKQRNAAAARLRRQKDKERIRDEKMRRRARRYTNVIELFSHRDVFDRDNRMCWICNEQCNDEQVPDPKAATIDHLVPLASGGEHLVNVRCAHFRCNSVRGNAMPTEHLEAV